MNEDYGPLDNEFQDDCGMDGYQDLSNEYISYPEYNRYNNAYGNYRGGYDRSSMVPLGFGPMNLMGPSGYPGPPGPPQYPVIGDVTWRRGYQGPPNNMYRGSRKEKIIKYLIRCGIPRDQVINLPHDVLNMMQPMNCGLCAQKFDSNDLSRIHYASKNHLKNQKKWVNQRSNSGSNGKEPLKSRDLYCELCDVHITSLGHADSHYAGKPHRSIVEGRKNPRNPFLLQPNKQSRLKALIRREQKFLKNSESTTLTKNLKSEAKPGELYCEICKTSMMCSEQMTTHLNGKRHLSKEKQHILRLMKGEVPEDNNKESSKEPEDNPDEGDDIEGDDYEYDEKDDEYDDDDAETGRKSVDKKSKGTGADDDDWEEGGEDWKPSAEDY